jgi:hypothetical protein
MNTPTNQPQQTSQSGGPRMHNELRTITITLELYSEWEANTPPEEWDNIKSYSVRNVQVNGEPRKEIDGCLPYPVFEVLNDEKAGFNITLEAASY